MAVEVVAPSGTVTFLFTDIVGSTRLWEQHPGEMERAVERHDEIVRSAIEDRGGYVFSTGGDAFAAAFGRVHDAVGAALAAQRGLAAEAWSPHVEIRVRMGVHTGEAQERNGDYFGPEVNRAARIMAAGHGGQVLLSAVTAAMCADADVMALGRHRLKDLTAPEELWQLGRDRFPLLRTLDVVRNNLPVAPTALVGRDGEVASVMEALEGSRVATLVGTGGVGKTRLALQVAAEMGDRFADGVWVCDLAAVDDRAGVLNTVLAAVDRDRGSGVTTGDVAGAVGEREVLLVLDNCEQVMAPVVELVEDLVAACGRTRLLLTSREAVRVPGEAVHVVEPLSTAGPESAAAALFVERAAAAGAADLGEAFPGVVELVAALDGLPLAIELAAARARAYSPLEMVELLDHRFRLLRDRHANSERHGALEAAVTWSYDLLDDDERRLFERLSVFRGPASLTSIGDVCADTELDGAGVADALGALVDRSLLVAERREGRTWFRLLETLRHYATERLEASGSAEQWRARHANTYVELAERAASQLRQTDDSRDRWYRFVNEYDNVAAAADWAATTGRESLVERLQPAVARARFTVTMQGMGATARYLDHNSPDTAEQQAQRLHLQQEAFTSLVGLCRQLSHTEWELPTDCERWSVKDIVAHICSMVAAFTGAPIAPSALPADFDPSSDDPMFTMYATLTEMHVISRRKLPPAAVLAELEQLASTRLRHEAEGLVFDMPGRAMDEAVGVLAFDIWVHEQDIRRATNRPGNLDSDAAARAVDRGIAVLPYIVGKRIRPPDGTTLHLDITTPITRQLTINVRHGRATFSDPEPEPSVHLTMDTETFCCLSAGRWTSTQALQHGTTIHGDETLGLRFCDSICFVP